MSPAVLANPVHKHLQGCQYSAWFGSPCPSPSSSTKGVACVFLQSHMVVGMLWASGPLLKPQLSHTLTPIPHCSVRLFLKCSFSEEVGMEIGLYPEKFSVFSPAPLLSRAEQAMRGV